MGKRKLKRIPIHCEIRKCVERNHVLLNNSLGSTYFERKNSYLQIIFIPTKVFKRRYRLQNINFVVIANFLLQNSFNCGYPNVGILLRFVSGQRSITTDHFGKDSFRHLCWIETIYILIWICCYIFCLVSNQKIL